MLKLKLPRLDLWVEDMTRKIGKSVGNTLGNTYNLLKIQEEGGRAGRRDLHR